MEIKIDKTMQFYVLLYAAVKKKGIEEANRKKDRQINKLKVCQERKKDEGRK